MALDTSMRSDGRPSTDRGGHNAERLRDRISGFRAGSADLELMVFCYHLASRYVAMFRFFSLSSVRKGSARPPEVEGFRQSALGRHGAIKVTGTTELGPSFASRARNAVADG